MSTPLELLSAVPLFRDLDQADLGVLAKATRVETYGPGTTIVEIGEPGRSLFLITKGHVQVVYPARSSEFELARLGPGDFFGEMALLNDKPRSATVRAVGEVAALVLDKAEFRQLVLDRPETALSLLEVLSIRIRQADEQISGLSDQAIRDALTGLLNRRAFNERMLGECDRVRRYKGCFSLILLDLDHFKSINDTMGHDVGDAILTWIGRVLKEHTRAADMPFRVGGEEFAIICPATSVELAEKVSKRLVGVVSEATPPVPQDVVVTLSAGYATCPDHADTMETLYVEADQTLLAAKRDGRNRARGPGAVEEEASGE